MIGLNHSAEPEMNNVTFTEYFNYKGVRPYDHIFPPAKLCDIITANTEYEQDKRRA